MPNSRYKSGTFTIADVVEVPDFQDLILMVDNADVEDGAGRPKNIATVLRQYQEDLVNIINGVRDGEIPDRFFVPDLWHVTYGDASLFTPEDRDRIYEAWHLGNCIGRKYLHLVEPDWDTMMDPDKFPGAYYVKRIDQ